MQNHMREDLHAPWSCHLAYSHSRTSAQYAPSRPRALLSRESYVGCLKKITSTAQSFIRIDVEVLRRPTRQSDAYRLSEQAGGGQGRREPAGQPRGAAEQDAPARRDRAAQDGQPARPEQAGGGNSLAAR